MRRLLPLLTVAAFAWAAPAADPVPADQALEAISRDWGLALEWAGGPAPHVVVDPARPPLERLAGLCLVTRCGYSLWDDATGRPLLKVSPTDHVVRAYAVEGPLLLAWHGLATTRDHNFDAPGKPIRTTKYRLSLLEDPRSHAEAGDGTRAVRDIPVTFRIGDRTVEASSDHRPNVFGQGPQWEFAPRPEFTGTADLEVTVPYVAPTGTGKASLPWAAGGASRTPGAVLTLKGVESEKDTDRDPSDPFKQIEITRLKAHFHLIHPDAVGLMPADSKTPPSPEQWKAIQAFGGKGRGVLAPHEARLKGADGRVLEGVVRRADGMHGPAIGYSLRAEFTTPDPAFKPATLELSWAEGFEPREARLRIPGISFQP